MARTLSGVLVWVLLVSLVMVDAFYLPGLAPTNFCRKEIKKESENKDKCKVSALIQRPLGFWGVELEVAG